MTKDTDEKDNEDNIVSGIELDIIDKLYQESRQKKEDPMISLNRILRDYFNWHKPLIISGNIPFSKGLILRIFESLTDEQMDKIAQDFVKYGLQDQLLMLGRGYTLLSFMDLVCSWCQASGFPYVRDKVYNVDKYVIRFDMGPKWAIFFGKFIQTISEQFKDKNLETEIINNTVVFKIIDSLV